MTWRSISEKKQATSNLLKRRSHCLLTHLGLTHAQKSKTFKAPKFLPFSHITRLYTIHRYIKHAHSDFSCQCILPNHKPHFLTLLEQHQLEQYQQKKWKQKKHLAGRTLQATRSGLGAIRIAPKTLWGLDLSHFFKARKVGR